MICKNKKTPKLNREKLRTATGTGKEKFEKSKEEKMLNYNKPSKDYSSRKKLQIYITKVAEEICGRSKNDKKQPWITIEILDLMNEMSKRKQKDNKKEEYKRMCGEIQRKCRSTKTTYYNEICAELQELDKRQHNPRLFKRTKDLQQRKSYTKTKLKDKNGKTLLTIDEVLERWQEYVTELYSDNRQKLTVDNENNERVVKISKEEVQTVIKNLPKNKATGVDDIPAEFLQCCGPESLKILNVKYKYKIQKCKKIKSEIVEMCM